MSEIETEYLGRAIVYNDNSDLWVCRSLGMEAKTLSALKTKMGKFDAQTRKVRVEALHLPHLYGYGDGTKCTIVLLASDEEVWVTKAKKERISRYNAEEREVMSRHKIAAKELAEPTDHVEAALAEWREAQAKSKHWSAEANRIMAAIPRLTVDKIRELGVPLADKE
jgi:IS1 family transposase